MNKSFQAFRNEIKSFNYKNEPIKVFEIENFFLTKKFEEIFPLASELINKSIKTGIEFKGKSMILFTWEIENKISGWLCQFDKSKINLIEEHQILIDNIGGIIESFNGPESAEINGIDYNYSLTLNQDFICVGSLCLDKPSWLDYYLEWCKEKKVEPIDLSNSVFFTREANGANYFYERKTKEVLLFSYDNAFEFVEPLPNQPERSIYKVKGVENFREFVELIAKQWNKHFELK